MFAALIRRKAQINSSAIHFNPECGYLLRGGAGNEIREINIVSIREIGILEKWYTAVTEDGLEFAVCNACGRRHMSIINRLLNIPV